MGRRRGLSARGERGNIAVLTAGVLLSLVLLCAFAVDVGMATLTRRQLQNASDAAALAAAWELDGTAEGLTRARDRAAEVAARHDSLRDPVLLGTGGGDGTPDVQTGIWDLAERTFTQSIDPKRSNAVRVQGRRYAARGEGIPTAFGALAGFSDIDVGSDAVAVGAGVGLVECVAPFTIPQCALDLNPNYCTDPTPLSFNPSTTNTMGFAVFGGSASTTTIAAQIDACAGYSGADPVCLANGANLASPSIWQPLVAHVVAGELWDEPGRPIPPQHSKSTVPPGDYGKVWRTYIPVFDGGTGYCSPPDSYNQCGMAVVSFVPFALYDVVPHGSTKTIFGFIDCDAEVPGAYGGGIYYGPGGRPRLVR
ncbi:Tad domain-containing protein [Myxococcota bacterium]|nr:Tad domain-containing protein [Myxococcota bacterium]